MDTAGLCDMIITTAHAELVIKLFWADFLRLHRKINACWRLGVSIILVRFPQINIYTVLILFRKGRLVT